MSFVSVIATENFISICSDGRAVNWQGERFTVSEGYYKKFILPTPETFVAFAGTMPLIGRFICETALNRLSVSDYGARADELQGKLRQPPYTSGGDALFGYGGRNPGGGMKFCVCGTSVSAAKVFRPKNGDIHYSFFYNDKTMAAEAGLDDAGMVEIFTSFLGITGFDAPLKVFDAQKALNNYVADRNPVVDKRVSWGVIT